MTRPEPTAGTLRFGVFELDPRAGELRKRGVKLRLRGQPLLVLATLLQHAGDVVTREQLRAQIWHDDTFVDFDHSLHNAIAKLRETLGDSAERPRYIETLPRHGYRFIVPVEESATEKSASKGGSEGFEVQSIAVLPLEDLTHDPAQDYFADSMTEALITSLAKVRALRVISRTSVMRYKGARKSLPEIARELKVDAVIDGSVLRAGERIRINTQLIHAASDRHLWAESYERDFRDILSLQSDIAQQVADQIKVILTPEERERLSSARKVNPQAHEQYLKARYYWNKRAEPSVIKAISYFRQSIDADPTYAEGYVGLADCYNILGYYNSLAPMEAYPKAKAAALKALEWDKSLGEAHAALGVVKRDFEWDWPGAEQEFQCAIELNPGCVEAYHWRGTLFCMMRRHTEGLREKTKALTLDPLSVVVRSDLARMYYYARDYSLALEHYRAAIAMDPEFGFAHLLVAEVYEQLGRPGEARTALEEGVRLLGESPFALAKLGHYLAISGKRDEARHVLDRLEELARQEYVSACDVAMVYTGLKENDAAFHWLDKAYQQRAVGLGYLGLEQHWDPLRTDLRFTDLLRRVNLATVSAL